MSSSAKPEKKADAGKLHDNSSFTLFTAHGATFCWMKGTKKLFTAGTEISRDTLLALASTGALPFKDIPALAEYVEAAKAKPVNATSASGAKKKGSKASPGSSTGAKPSGKSSKKKAISRPCQCYWLRGRKQ
jgi:hypothetical protein